MAVINRVPQGLLSILDAKTLGETPATLGNEVQPGLEMLELYLSNVPIDARTAQQTVTSASTGSTVALVEVPAGELWAIIGVTASLVLVSSTIASGMTFAAVFRNTQTALDVTIDHVEDATPAIVLAGASCGKIWEKPLLAPPGTIFGNQMLDISGAGGNLSALTSVAFRRLQF